MVQNKRSLLKKFLQWISAAAALFILGVAAILIWHSAQNSTPDSSHYPFKSQQAKEEFLTFYDEKAKQWPVVSTTKMLNTSYGQTFVRISGPADADPLLLLHGGGGNALQWIPNVEAFSRHYRVFAVDDIHGHGRSIPTRAMETPEDYVRWLNEVLDALALQEPVNIAGLSYGGWVTAHYALRFPQRLNKIILITPAATVIPFSAEWIFRATPVLLSLRYFTREFMQWLAKDTIESGAEGRAAIDEYIEEKLLSVRAFNVNKMLPPDVLSDEQLHSLHVPTLFLVGENEKSYPAHKAVERLNRVAPQIQTKIIMNAGHDLAIVKAETVNRAIVEFLRQASQKESKQPE